LRWTARRWQHGLGLGQSDGSKRALPGYTQVNLAATVTGPADYESVCVQTVHFWALDVSGNQVWAEPVPMIACMAIGYRHLRAGETATFQAAWPTSPQLARGTYSIHGLFLFSSRPALPLGYARICRL
jgi:hypothetical protein